MGENDFDLYGCFSSNELGTDYRTFGFEEERSGSFLKLVITINTVIGIFIFVGLLLYHKQKRRSEQMRRDHQSPIFRGNSGVFDEMVLEKEMQEEYIDMDIFDNLNKRK